MPEGANCVNGFNTHKHCDLADGETLRLSVVVQCEGKSYIKE